ncbi:DUF4913 domain-containing protein [Actinomadura harenae]|uniref:DUF4913 domain-containing protein n=1 Tax=Actinomadura harenae TaxID=2483351 RepID=A0A3M2M2F3_9ACTN|nr:DUF4913 domain-containing protein [Actinomadura harenae]RMI43924.1 DUF4913 domain-containing protein [Actinomadura harenae]
MSDTEHLPAATAAPGDTPARAVVRVTKPYYSSVTVWVTEYFVPTYRRTLGGEFRWCAQWWNHAEAISRLSALWQSWEACRLQGATGVGLWYRDHLDPQLPILLGARGPFCQCTEQEHLEPHQARLEPPPLRWWDDPAPQPDEQANA